MSQHHFHSMHQRSPALNHSQLRYDHISIYKDSIYEDFILLGCTIFTFNCFVVADSCMYLRNKVGINLFALAEQLKRVTKQIQI